MTPQDLRLMRKKARVSLQAMARELDVPLVVVRNIEDFPSYFPDCWADRYVEALTKLTA
jgi:hypothetical protein